MSLILERRILIPFAWTLLTLATAAFIAELLPEVKAKMIVMPTLLLIIGFTSVLLWKNRK